MSDSRLMLPPVPSEPHPLPPAQPPPSPPSHQPPSPRSRVPSLRVPAGPGRWLARILCLLFAVIGVLPFAFAIFVRTDAARAWAARSLSRLLSEQFGVQASFTAAIHPWPLTLIAGDVRVESNDGRGPALLIDQLSVRPKFFALVQGQLDVGDIEIDHPRIRASVRDGKLTNLDLKTPSSRQESTSDRAPFSSIAVNDAEADLDIDGVVLRATRLDLDVASEEGGVYEISLHAGAFFPKRTRMQAFGDEPPQQAHDEDAICKADGRVRISPDSVLVRRLRLWGAADLDPAPDTMPGCDLPDSDLRRVEFELRNARVGFDAQGPSSVNGFAHVRIPFRLANRLTTMPPMFGWGSFDADGSWKRGMNLPDLRATVDVHEVMIADRVVAKALSGTARIANDVVTSPRLLVHWADGEIEVRDFEIRPMQQGAPLKAAHVHINDMTMQGLVRDLGVTPHAFVKTTFHDGNFTNITGQISPLFIDSDLVVQPRDFEVTAGSWDDAKSPRVIGFKQGKVHTNFVVTHRSVEFRNSLVEFGTSRLQVYCSLGFDNIFRLSVARGARVELAELGPLLDMRWSGVAEPVTEITGTFDNPTIAADLAVKSFEFAGFSFGDVQSGKLVFRPVPPVMNFTDLRVRKANSSYRLPSMRIDFGGSYPIALDVDVESQDLDVRDFFSILRFDTDPRLASIRGAARVKAGVRLEIGSPRDRCGGGFLSVRTQAHFHRLELLGEKFDEGDLDLDYRSDDQRARDLGIEVDVRSATLRKGKGIVFGEGTVRTGGIVRAHLAASDVPLSRLQVLGKLGSLAEATVGATAEVRGTLDRLEADLDVRMSQLRVGTSLFPASRAAVRLVPVDRPVKILGRTQCGLPITPAFDKSEFAKDLPMGMFHVTGQLFGGQLTFQDLRLTRQSKVQVTGQVQANRLNIGQLASSKNAGDSATATHGWVSALLDIKSFEIDAPERADISLAVSELEAGNVQGKVKLRTGTPLITLAGDELAIPSLMLDFSSPRGVSGTFAASGKVRHLAAGPELDLSARLLPLDLSALGVLLPQLERASGTAQATVSVTGPLAGPRYGGELTVRNGALALKGFPLPLDNANIDVLVNEREIRLERATARMGGGSVSATGTLPVKGFDFGTAMATITARRVSLPVLDGVNMVVDADLTAAWSARSGEEARSVPRVVGDVTFVSFDYARPIAISADIGSLAGRNKRTRFESYDPEDDVVAFEVRLLAANPMRLRNNMADMQLTIDSRALTLTGTNQRVGLRGDLRVKPGGRLKLRTSEFEVRHGSVRFEDPTHITPIVDVTAVTDYRRYSQAQSGTTASSAATAGAGAGASGGVGRTGGQWRIQMHAHGDEENLKLDLTSEPGLSQEDIVLLLTLGVTRAELDQMQAANIGGTAALEALSTLTGADSAVREAIPVIDDFRLGSAYSSRTGRTEPTVTMGKRVTDRVRATVTSGLSENREMRSNVEWQLTPRTSVLGSYDNVNNVSSSALGNVGADMRFRIEFK